MKIIKRNLREDFKDLSDDEFSSAELEYDNFIDKVLGNIALGISIFILIIQVYLVGWGDKFLFTNIASDIIFARMTLIVCCLLVILFKFIKALKVRGLYLMHIFLFGAFFMTTMVVGISKHDADSTIVWIFLAVFIGGIIPISFRSSLVYIFLFIPFYVAAFVLYNGTSEIYITGFKIINVAAIGGFGLLFKYHFHWMFKKEFFSKRLIKKMTEERVNVESLERLNREKDEFLATTAHELRTPLNGIIGLVDTYLENENDNTENLNIAVSAAKRLSFLVNDIVDCSKLKDHKLEINFEPVNAKQMVDITVSLLNPLIGNKKIDISTNIESDNLALLGDEKRVLQILNNIVGNAIKYTEEGEIKISVFQDNSKVRIEVKDTGIGIDKDKIDLIFNNYTMAGENRSIEGAGIGLYFTKELMTLHKGEIEVKSTKGKGSVFTLIFEKGEDVESKRERILNIPAGFKEPEFIQGREMVAIVDDHPLNLRTFANYISGLYNVVLYSNGNDFLDDFNSGKVPDVILLDLVLPDIHGIEICKNIREKYSRTDLPVIMITAGTKEKDMEDGLKAGANEFLHKPVFREALRIRVNNQIELLRRHKTVIEGESIISFIESLVEISASSSLDCYIDSYAEKLDKFLSQNSSEIDSIYSDRITKVKEVIESKVKEKPFLIKLLTILSKVDNRESFEDFCIRFKLSDKQSELVKVLFTYSTVDTNSLAEIMKTSSTNITSILHRVYTKMGIDNKAQLMQNLENISNI